MFGLFIGSLSTAYNEVVDLKKRVVADMQSVEVLHHAGLATEGAILGATPDVFVVGEGRQILVACLKLLKFMAAPVSGESVGEVNEHIPHGNVNIQVVEQLVEHLDAAG